jgi:hypothetical protein
MADHHKMALDAFRMQRESINEIGVSIVLKQLRLACNGGADENTYMPRIGMTVADVCVHLVLLEKKSTLEQGLSRGLPL